MNLAKRVDRLEQSSSPKDPPPVVQVIVEAGESEEDVIARWRMKHPEAPVEIFFVVIKLVKPPQHQEIRP